MLIENTSSVLVVSSLCAPPVSLRRRFWRFSNGASRAIQRLNCMKPPSSSGKLQKSGSKNGFKNETNFYAYFGPRAGQARSECARAFGKTEPLRRLALVDFGLYRPRWSVSSVAPGQRVPFRGRLPPDF